MHILGVGGFYRNFIQNYTEIVASFTTANTQAKVSVSLILHFLDFDGEFILDADAKLIRFAASFMNIKAKY